MFQSHPQGLKSLFFIELWERFSYYGMRALLVLFMVAPIAGGGLALETAEAARLYGTYTMAVYMLSIPGGFLADNWFGARRAVLIGGAVIAAGHFTLAVPAETTFYIGLVLVALGTGLFKPNVSALVGALYSPGDDRRDAGFSLYYMGINIGAFIAPLVTGFLAQSVWFKSLLSQYGFDPAASWHWGFAAAGVGMTIALLILMYRGQGLRDTIDVPQLVPGFLWRATLVALGTLGLILLVVLSDKEGFEFLRYFYFGLPVAAILWLGWREGADARRMAAVGVLFMASMLFWGIFEQAGLSIALFADQLTERAFFGQTFPSAWFQSLNPLFVIMLAPLFALMWTRLGARQPSSPVKFVLGLVFLSASFLLMVPAAALALAGKVSPLWLVGLFLLQTIGELFLSPVGLSTMTKLAPPRLTGVVLGVWFLSAAFGNKLAGILGSTFDASSADKLTAFFLYQGLLVAAAAVILLLLTPWVKRLMGDVR